MADHQPAKGHTKRRLRRTTGLLLLLLALGLTAWFSQQHRLQYDWTLNQRNSLSATSIALLASLTSPVEITVYIDQDHRLRQRIRDYVLRFQRYKPDIRLEFVDPDEQAAEAREKQVTVNGELFVRYQGREERLKALNEQMLSNTLSRLARGGERWLAFLQGHGERRLDGKANFDLGVFGQQLQQRGVRLTGLNLAETREIPDNTGLLVVAGPRSAFSADEVARLSAYLAGGGNLLWLTDADSSYGLEVIRSLIPLQQLPGTLIDPRSSQPAVTVVTAYPPHPATQGLQRNSYFPAAAALQLDVATLGPGWRAQPLFESAEQAWNETGPLSGTVKFNAEDGEREGPFVIGFSFSRSVGEGAQAREQRLAVIGNGDFLANQFLGNGGNLDLGLALVEWLNHDDAFINIRTPTAPDLQLDLAETTLTAIGALFILLLPLGFLITGLLIWRRRRGL